MSVLLKYYLTRVQAKLAASGTPVKKPSHNRKSRRRNDDEKASG